jgi:hypothetical protein
MKSQSINDLISGAGLNSSALFVTVHRYDGGRLLTAYSSYPVPEPLGTWQSLGKGIVGRAASRAETVHVRHVSVDSDYFAMYPGMKSELAIPLSQDGSIVAVVNFESTTAGTFDDWESSIFSRIANELGHFFELDQIPGSEELIVPTSSLVEPESSHECSLAIEEVSENLLRSLAKDPNLLYQITPRRFEEVVAKILEDQGFTVKLTPPQKDGGIDMFAECETSLGKLLTIVECKRYTPRNPVRVDLVRNLYGVLNINRATQALIATTSYFTSEARSLQELFKYQMSLKDFGDISEWLQRYR